MANNSFAFYCKVNKLTSYSEEKGLTCMLFYVFLAKLVAKNVKMTRFECNFDYLTQGLDRFSIKMITFANKSAKEPRNKIRIMQLG